MKRKWIVLLVVIAMLLGMLPGVQGLSPLCFVATNDSVPLILYGGENPYYSSGKLYIPHNAFDANPNGVGVSYDTEKNTFLLFSRGQTLIFDLKARTYKDSLGKTYNTDIVYRGGVVYLPASIAGHFGLSVTLLFSRYGYPIVRFTDGEQVYDDGTFVAQAENLINRAVEEYERNSQNSSGDQNDAVNREDDDPQNKTNVYLSFAGEAVNRNTLDMLTRAGASGAFFLSADQILTDRELVRDIYAAGHTVGVTVSPEEWDVPAAIDNANDALDQVLFCRSVFVMLPRGMTYQTESYRVLNEPAAMSVEDVLQAPETEHLYVVRSGAVEAISAFVDGGAALLRLRETSF